MKTRAAVAFEAKKPLEIVEVDLEGPRGGRGADRDQGDGHLPHRRLHPGRAGFGRHLPSILGHEGAGVVVEIGPGVTSLAVGDHVIPLYTPECRQCKSCLSRKTNLCTQIRATQGKGLMPDGTSRFSYKGQQIAHYMGCSTFSNYTVLPEIAVAKIRKDAPFQSACYVGCGVTTGVGAVVNTAKVEPGANCVVFGLGGIGLNVIQGLKLAGADKIVGVDINPSKEEWGRRFGMTHFVNKEIDSAAATPVPAGDASTNTAQKETFSIANVVPQTPTLNRNKWRVIEETDARGRRLCEPTSSPARTSPPCPPLSTAARWWCRHADLEGGLRARSASGGRLLVREHGHADRHG